jgi:hypothetical protein
MSDVPLLPELAAEFRDANPDFAKLTAEEVSQAFRDYCDENGGGSGELVREHDGRVWIRFGTVGVDWTQKAPAVRARRRKTSTGRPAPGDRPRIPARPPLMCALVESGDLVFTSSDTVGRLGDVQTDTDGSLWANVYMVDGEPPDYNCDYYLDELEKLGDEVCQACGEAKGTGTLLDFQPSVPPAGREMGFPYEKWARFAERYRCPACVDAFPRRPRKRSTAASA